MLGPLGEGVQMKGERGVVVHVYLTPLAHPPRSALQTPEGRSLYEVTVRCALAPEYLAVGGLSVASFLCYF